MNRNKPLTANQIIDELYNNSKKLSGNYNDNKSQNNIKNNKNRTSNNLNVINIESSDRMNDYDNTFERVNTYNDISVRKQDDEIIINSDNKNDSEFVRDTDFKLNMTDSKKDLNEMKKSRDEFKKDLVQDFIWLFVNLILFF